MKVSEMIKNMLSELSKEISQSMSSIRKAVAEDKEIIKQAKDRIEDNMSEVNAIEFNAREFANEMEEVANLADEYHYENETYMNNLQVLVNDEIINTSALEEEYDKGYEVGYNDCLKDYDLEDEEEEIKDEDLDEVIADSEDEELPF